MNSYKVIGKRAFVSSLLKPGQPQPGLNNYHHANKCLDSVNYKWGALINKLLSGRRHLSQWREKGRQLGTKNKIAIISAYGHTKLKLTFFMLLGGPQNTIKSHLVFTALFCFAPFSVFLTEAERVVIDGIYDKYLEKGIICKVDINIQKPWNGEAIYWLTIIVHQPKSETTPVRPCCKGKAKHINGKSIK
jgi:hypothetical protein